MEYIFYNSDRKAYLLDDEDSSETRNLQNAMIAVGEKSVERVLQAHPSFQALPVVRPKKEEPFFIELINE